MSKTIASFAAAAALLSFAVADAQAEGGCGPGFHRNAFGHCRPNGPVVVVPAAPVVVAPAAPAVVVAPPAVVVAPVGGCGLGRHWSPRWHRCVLN